MTLTLAYTSFVNALSKLLNSHELYSSSFVKGWRIIIRAFFFFWGIHWNNYIALQKYKTLKYFIFTLKKIKNILLLWFFSLGFFYLITGNLYLFDYFHSTCLLPTVVASSNHQSILCEFGFFFFFFKILHVSEITQYNICLCLACFM